MSETETIESTLPRLLTVAELATGLGLSEKRVYQLVSKDQIPVVRLGRALRFPSAAVAQFLRSGGTATSEPIGR